MKVRCIMKKFLLVIVIVGVVAAIFAVVKKQGFDEVNLSGEATPLPKT